MLVSTALVSFVADPNALSVAEEQLISFKWDSSVADCKTPREIVKNALSY
jgi:hypothetical protein